MNEQEVEVLPPEKETDSFPILRVGVPMERLKDLFDGIATAQASALLWADKMVVDSPKSRDEARNLRQSLQSTRKAIQERRIQLMKPIDDYQKELKALCDNVCLPFDKAVEIIDAKGVAFANECKRIEAEEKARAAAKLEEERKKKEQAERERQAEEDRLQLIEAEKVRKMKAEALALAKKNGDDATAKAQAEEVARRESARIEQERAAREKANADQRAKEQAELDAAQAKMVQDMAKATGTGKTKGVKNVWVIEIVDERKIPEQFKTYDPKKARKYCEAGLSSESDPFKIIPGLNCYTALTSTGR